MSLLRRAPRCRRGRRAGDVDFAGIDLGVALCRDLRRHVLGRGLRERHRHAAIGFMKFTGVDRLLGEQGAAATEIALEHVVTTLNRPPTADEVTYLAATSAPTEAR